MKQKNIAVIIVLLTIAVILFSGSQYLWFARIAANEYEQMQDNLAANVHRTMLRESQRFGIIYDWLFTMIDPKETYTLKQVTDIADSLYDTFGEDSETSYLIEAVQILQNDPSSDELLVWEKVDDRRWMSHPAGPGYDELLGGWGTGTEGRSFPEYFDGSSRTSSVQVSSELSLIMFSDMQRFYERYVLPDITDDLEGFDLQFILDSDQPQFQNYAGPSAGEGEAPYRFDPSRIFFSTSSSQEHLLLLPVMILEDFRKGTVDRRSKLEEYTQITIDQADYLLGLKASKDSYISVIEKSFSLVMFAGICLMILIALLCLFLLRAWRTAEHHREREREFTASITHDLRTPLTVIQSAAVNLSDGVVKPERIPVYCDMIRQQSDELGGIIENMLLYARIEGKEEIPIHRSSVNMPELFEELGSETRLLSEKQQVPVLWDVGGIPRTCRTDRQLLKQLLKNILYNALLHAYGDTEGSVRVKARYHQDRSVELLIEDEGVGIGHQEQRDIFEAYRRGEHTKETMVKGSGLGLFIAQRNARLLGGGVSLQSPYNRLDGVKVQGCRFSVIIPCVQEKEDA